MRRGPLGEGKTAAARGRATTVRGRTVQEREGLQGRWGGHGRKRQDHQPLRREFQWRERDKGERGRQNITTNSNSLLGLRESRSPRMKKSADFQTG